MAHSSTINWKSWKIIFAVLLGICLYGMLPPKLSSITFDFTDLQMRYNEVSLAHEGINPFYVWNHEIEHEKYCGWYRPDMKSNCNGKEEKVHYYPPWHFTFFWWYPYFPKIVCAGIFFFSYLAIFFFFLRYLSKWAPPGILDRIIFWEILAMSIFDPFFRVIDLLNYSPLLLVAMFVFCQAMQRNRQILLGLAWAVLMIKPQIGALFIFPLLFSHKFKSIAIVVGICSLATLWPAFIFHESPIDLVLQIFKMGEPYLNGQDCYVFSRKLVHLIGPSGRFIWAAFCVILCGSLCFFVSKNSSILIRISPVLLCFPIVSYYNTNDFILLWPLLFLFALTLFDRGYFLASQKAKLILMALFLAQPLPHFLATYSPLQLFIATILFDYDSAYQLYNLVYLFCIKTFFPFLQVGCTASIVAYFVYRILKTKPEEINPLWKKF